MMNDFRSVKDLQGEAIVARDGPIGSIVALYFDDERWAVRYLVVDTGNPMPQRQVLIPPASIERAPAGGPIRVTLTREQVEKSPDAETERPVWRQHELTYAALAASDPHLRSSEVVGGCRVEARDGAIGHVEDFIVDGENWNIAGLVVATTNWLPGKRVLIDPQAVERIDWPYRRVHVRLTRKAIRELPAYAMTRTPDRRKQSGI
ncbi:MAG TPA: PRC-barrel domain-containing protein [Burkholderiales bacterium]|nr:PRC-barrel domain-containing protein [Burkholderiales bacterium]